MSRAKRDPNDPFFLQKNQEFEYNKHNFHGSLLVTSNAVKFYDFDVRIAYADTDRMGVVYYANYLVLFERGRTEFLRSLGVRYRDLEEQQGLFLPALASSCRYLAPGRYDDLIKVRTFISELGGAHMNFRYEITLVDTNQLIATGATEHAVVNKVWRPTRLPFELRQLLASHIEK